MPHKFTTIEALLQYTQHPLNSASKAFCNLGVLPVPAAEIVAEVLDISETEFNLLLDSDGIRHTLKQHGIAKSKAEIARGQIPIIEADLLNLENWLHRPTAVQCGQVRPGKQPCIEMQWESSVGTTFAILEWRPSRKQLALVTMYKKRPAA